MTKLTTTQSNFGLCKKSGLFLAVALSASLLTACGGGGGGTTTVATDTTPAVVTPTPVTPAPAARTFTKMDKDGGDVTTGIERVACVKDSLNGKFWEVKTDEAAGQTQKGEDFRDKDYGYFWYDGTNGAPGLTAGTAVTAKLSGNTIPCQASGAALTTCNTQSYINAVKAVKLCGKTTWRLPTKDELLSLVDQTQTKAPYIYPDLGSTASEAQVANQATRGYWSSTVSASDPAKRSAVSFGAKAGLVEDHFMHNQLYNYDRLIAD